MDARNHSIRVMTHNHNYIKNWQRVIRMQETHEALASLLQEKNNGITYEQALRWVELLWSDFEATYAKAGHKYMGSEMTEKVVRQWIENYGSQLHEFVARNPKYKHLLEEE
jgi:hypothetical protein